MKAIIKLVGVILCFVMWESLYQKLTVQFANSDFVGWEKTDKEVQVLGIFAAALAVWIIWDFIRDFFKSGKH